MKRRVIVRLSPLNRLSFPVLLNAWEQYGIDAHFDILVRTEPLLPREFQPGDIVLFSFMTSVLPAIHEEIKTIKALKIPGILLCAGGPHVNGEQELSYRMGFDILFKGPGEETFVDFGNDLIGGRVLRDRYESRGNQFSGDYLNRFFPVSRHIDTIPPLEIMRGCYWNCRYCSTSMERVHFRSISSADYFFKEMKKRRMTRLNFISPSSMEYGAVKGRRLRLDLIEELLFLAVSYRFPFNEYGIFPSEVRPDTVTDEGVRMLKKYVSNTYITIGAQSGLNERLRQLRRGHTVEDIERAVAIANNNGFRAFLDFIVGYPDETGEERRATVDFIKRINKKYRIRAHLHHFIPIAGSPYGFRFPSFLNPMEKEELVRLKSAGIVIDGWVSNEQHAQVYLNWLKTEFPGYYSRFS